VSDKKGVGQGNKDINEERKEHKRIMKVKILTLNGIRITVAKLTTSVIITRHSSLWYFYYLEFL